MNGFHLRSYVPADAPAFLALYNRLNAQETPLESFLEQQAARAPEDARVQRVVEAAEGSFVGLSELRAFDYLPPGWRLLTLGVQPPFRERGLGAALLAEAERSAATLGAGGLVVSVLDDDPQSRAWAERCGFALHAHRFASRLDLQALTEQQAEQQDAPLPPGIELRDMTRASLAEWAALDRLFGDLMAQTPDLAGQPRWTPEQVQAHLSASPRLRPEWVLTVQRGAELLGLCVGMPISTGVYNELTGVVVGARGLGLASAMKLELIRRARAAGVPSMLTHNHAANLAMLSVNRRLGFGPLAGLWELRRELA